jgi:long-subunit fatty acid transport protein
VKESVTTVSSSELVAALAARDEAIRESLRAKASLVALEMQMEEAEREARDDAIDLGWLNPAKGTKARNMAADAALKIVEEEVCVSETLYPHPQTHILTLRE